MSGWIRLHRKMLDSSLWQNPNACRLFLYLLMRARHTEGSFPFNGQDIILQPGELISSHDSLRTGIAGTFSLSQIRTALEYLKTTGRIAVKTNNKFSIISICNWDEYQSDDRQDDNPVAGQSQASRRPVATNKNVRMKECKNEDTPLPPKGKRRRAEKYHDFVESDFEWPPKWQAGARAAMQRWVEYKSKAGHPAILMSYQSQVRSYAEDPRLFNRLVNRAIDSTWQGLNAHVPFEQPRHMPNVPDPHSNRPPPKLYEPPPAQPEPTAEQKSAAKALIDATIAKIASRK